MSLCRRRIVCETKSVCGARDYNQHSAVLSLWGGSVVPKQSMLAFTNVSLFFYRNLNRVRTCPRPVHHGIGELGEGAMEVHRATCKGHHETNQSKHKCIHCTQSSKVTVSIINFEECTLHNLQVKNAHCAWSKQTLRSTGWWTYWFNSRVLIPQL